MVEVAIDKDDAVEEKIKTARKRKAFSKHEGE